MLASNESTFKWLRIKPAIYSHKLLDGTAAAQASPSQDVACALANIQSFSERVWFGCDRPHGMRCRLLSIWVSLGRSRDKGALGSGYMCGFQCCHKTAVKGCGRRWLDRRRSCCISSPFLARCTPAFSPIWRPPLFPLGLGRNQTNPVSKVSQQ